jgi:hypothetical protein
MEWIAGAALLVLVFIAWCVARITDDVRASRGTLERLLTKDADDAAEAERRSRQLGRPN